MMYVSTLANVYEALKSLGYEATLKDESVAIRVGGLDKPFIALITYNKSTNHFQITCMVARLGLIPEDNLLHFTMGMLDANMRIAPFAYALITDSVHPDDDEIEEWPIVLVHRVPVGDLSLGELDSAMKSLVAALLDGAGLIGYLGLPAEKPAAVKKASYTNSKTAPASTSAKKSKSSKK